MGNQTNKMANTILSLDIDSISDECYKLLLNEFKKKAKEEGINWDDIEEDYLQTWELKCKLQKY